MDRPQVGVAFLLSQVGAHAAFSFEERLAPIGLKPYHAGLLRMLNASPGLTQQAISDLFGIFPSRLVQFLDDLVRQQLIERRDNPADRRSYLIYLTPAGQQALSAINALTLELEDNLCAVLSSDDRTQLEALLRRIVAQQNITPAVHPAYRKLRKETQ